MAKLSAFRANAAAINAGRWIDVGPDDDTFRIKTKGFTGKYRDALARMMGDHVRRMNRGKKPGDRFFTEVDIAVTDQDAMQAEVLAEHCFLDVEGLTHDDGQSVTADEFRDLIRTEAGRPLLLLAMGAAARVGDDTEEAIQDAVGNSPAASAGS